MRRRQSTRRWCDLFADWSMNKGPPSTPSANVEAAGVLDRTSDAHASARVTLSPRLQSRRPPQRGAEMLKHYKALSLFAAVAMTTLSLLAVAPAQAKSQPMVVTAQRTADLPTQRVSFADLNLASAADQAHSRTPCRLCGEAGVLRARPARRTDAHVVQPLRGLQRFRLERRAAAARGGDRSGAGIGPEREWCGGGWQPCHHHLRACRLLNAGPVRPPRRAGADWLHRPVRLIELWAR